MAEDTADSFAEDTAYSFAEDGLSGGQGQGIAHLSDVSTKATMLTLWSVSCLLTGDIGKTHCAAKPPKCLTELIALHQSFSREQHIIALSRFTSCLVCCQMSKCNPGLISCQLCPLRIGCRARIFLHFASKNSYRDKFCFCQGLSRGLKDKSSESCSYDSSCPTKS